MARAMKDSGIPWIGEIPEEWKVSRVGLHFDIILGKMLCSEPPSEEYTLEKYYCAANVHFDGISETDIKSMWFSQVEKEQYKVHQGDLLIVEGGAGAGGCAIVDSKDEDIYIQNSIMIVRPKEKECNLYLRYLIEYLVKSGYIDVVCNKATIPHFTKDKLSCVPFLLSDQGEQIASFLDAECARIDAVIEKTCASIEEYKKLKQAVITEAVTKGIRSGRKMKDSGITWIGEIPEEWEVRPLKAYIDILPGYAFSSDDFSTEGGIPLLRGINVSPGSIRWDDTVYWDKPVPEQLEQFRLNEGDLVVGLDRPWVSEGTRVAFITRNDLPSLLLQRVCRIRAKNNTELKFVFHLLSGRSFEEALSTDTTGVSVPHISTKQIQNYTVAIPSYDEQIELCDYLDVKCARIDNLVELKQKLIIDLESYKKSIIYEYVTGKKEVIDE